MWKSRNEMPATRLPVVGRRQDMLANQHFECDTADEAFLHWYDTLLSQDDNASSRDGEMHGEILNAVTVIKDPTRGICQNDIRNMSMRYALGEMLWYMSGKRDLKEIQKYTSAWDRVSDDGETVNSNYGWCIRHKFGFDQWDNARLLLSANPNTRQAVIHIKEASDDCSLDVNCTVCLQFLLRDGKLYLTTYMRSNDIWLGFPYDVFQFTSMQVLMSMELGAELGTYTHIAGSLHLYERDIVKTEEKRG